MYVIKRIYLLRMLPSSSKYAQEAEVAIFILLQVKRASDQCIPSKSKQNLVQVSIAIVWRQQTIYVRCAEAGPC